MKIITGAIVFLAFFHPIIVKSEKCFIPISKNSNYKLPEFVDSAKFKADLIIKVGLKWTYQEFKKQGVVEPYMYTFIVSKNGKIIPRLYYDKNLKELSKIHRYVTTIFNESIWKPAYKEGCKSCIVPRFLKLAIFIENENKQIEVEIKDIITQKRIFKYLIPFEKIQG